MSTATDQALASIQNYKQLSSTDAINNANQQYDVAGSQSRLSALKGIVGNLQSSVEAVDPSVTGRTSGTFTTEGQRSALVSKEQAPIVSNLNKQQGAYSDEQSTLTNKQNLASQMATALLNDDKTNYQKLLDQYNLLSAADKDAEDKRRYEETRQDSLAAAAASASSKAASSATSKTSVISSLNDDITGNLADFKNKPKGWTEKVLIPQLIAAYPELTAKQITDNVYNLRKQYE